MIEALVAVAALVGGAVASLVGFGLGSFLTPVFILTLDPKLAVAAVAFPHLAATALRAGLMWRDIDWSVLRGFGIASAAGGLIGAFMLTGLRSVAVLVVFGALLVFVGVSGLAGWAQRIRFEGAAAWVAGTVSGLLGGLAGNQGGIRSGAMLGLGVSKQEFVATATAIGLMVDLVRTPVYLASLGAELLKVPNLIAIAVVSAVVGTLVGRPLLERVPERSFRKVVSGLVLALGVAMLAQAF